MVSQRLRIRLTVLVLIVCAIRADAFTYQGKLTDANGQPANGNYTMTFKVFDQLVGGNQIGGLVTRTGVQVKDGLFTVELGYGVSTFGTSAPRYLEVTVGTQTLTPRTEITSVPRAVYAESVPWTGITGVPTSFAPSGSAGGDLAGTYPNPTIADGKVDSPALASDAFSLGKVSGNVMTSFNGRIGIGTASPANAFEVVGRRGVLDQAATQPASWLLSGSTVAQSFTAGISGTLYAIEALVCSGEYNVMTIPATLTIYNGDGTTGAVLSTQRITVPYDRTYHLFLLATPVEVAAGDVYTFEVNSGGRYINVKWQPNNAYTRGSFFLNNSPDSYYDMNFRTYVASGTATGLAVQPTTLNVGVGTATPGFPLSFADTYGDKIGLWGNSASHYGLGVQPALLQIHADGPGSDIAFGHGSSGSFTETMRIKGNGKVGIGTATPLDALSVNGGLRLDQSDQNGNTLGTGAIRFGGSGTGEGIACNRSVSTAGENQWGLDFYTLSTRRMSITLGGNVGIGTTNPAYKLHVNGSVAGVGAYNQLSDARYKTNIEEIPSALDKVERLRGVTFDWKADEHPEIDFGAARQAGVLAQEVRQVLPEAVTESADGTYSVSYSSLVPLLIEAIKEQQKTIERLESRDAEIDTLKAEIEALKAGKSSK